MQPDEYLPSGRVSIGAAAGAAVALLVWVFNKFILPEDKPITPEIAAALTTLVMFLVYYLTDPPKEKILRLTGTYTGDQIGDTYTMGATLSYTGSHVVGEIRWTLTGRGNPPPDWLPPGVVGTSGTEKVMGSLRDNRLELHGWQIDDPRILAPGSFDQAHQEPNRIRRPKQRHRQA
jgi:hypothetical protein